jgi:hypothetical protein
MKIKLLILSFLVLTSYQWTEAIEQNNNNPNIENIVKAVTSCFLSSAFNYKNFIGHYTPIVGTAWTATDFALCVRNKLSREEDVRFWEETLRDLAINNLFTYRVTSPVTSNWGKRIWMPDNFKNTQRMLAGRTVKANLFVLKQWLMNWFNRNGDNDNNHHDNNNN